MKVLKCTVNYVFEKNLVLGIFLVSQFFDLFLGFGRIDCFSFLLMIRIDNPSCILTNLVPIAFFGKL